MFNHWPSGFERSPSGAPGGGLLIVGMHVQRTNNVTRIARMIGCRIDTPLAWASAPMPKGSTAAPPPPKAAAKPMAETCK
jgi:hypothetical protein